MNIIVSRRAFLASAAATSLVGCRSFSPFGSSNPDIRFGVLSDIHVTTPESAAVFKNALRYFDAQGADAVMIAGDLADHGLLVELRNVADAWNEVFPDGKGSDGRPVEKLFIYGNHDPEGLKYRDVFMDSTFAKLNLSYEDAEKQTLSAIGLGAAWRECFGEEYASVYHKTVKGFDFFGAHWDPANGSGWNRSAEIRPLFSRVEGQLDPERPFFYFQHPSLRDTTFGSWSWSPDAGLAKAVLSRHPNAVAFSGHTHYPLTDERFVWRGEFTSIATGSLSYICLPGHRDNTDLLNKSIREAVGTPKAVAQGQLVSVYDGHMTVLRRDFVRDLDLGPALDLETPLERPCPFGARAAKAIPPEFAPNAWLKTERFNEKTADGKVEKVRFSFPPATASGTRAYDYELKVEVRYADVERVHLCRRLFSPSAALPSQADAEVLSISHEYEGWNFPKEALHRVTVTPLDSYGVRGKPLVGEWCVIA